MMTRQRVLGDKFYRNLALEPNSYASLAPPEGQSAGYLAPVLLEIQDVFELYIVVLVKAALWWWR